MRRTLRMRPAWLVVTIATSVAVVTTGAVVAVRAIGGDPAARPEPPVDLAVSLRQYRPDEVAHTIKVTVRHPGPQPIRVDRVELLTPSFEPTGAHTVDAPIPADLEVDLTVPLGTARCAGDTATVAPAAPARVVLQVRPEGGRARRMELPIRHPDPWLDRVFTADCQERYLRRATDVRFDPEWTVLPDGALAGGLLVERAGTPAPIVLHDVAGNTLYSLRTEPATRPRPLGTLAPGQSRLVVPVVLAPQRCGGHALGEIKKPYVFPTWISIGDGPKVYTAVGVDDPARAALADLISRLCRAPGAADQ